MLRMLRSLVAFVLLASATFVMPVAPVSARGHDGLEHRCLDVLDEAAGTGLAGVLTTVVVDPWCLVGAAVDSGVLGYGIAGCRSLPPTLHRCPHLTQGTWTQDLMQYGVRILRRIAGLPVPDAGPPVILPHGVTASPSTDPSDEPRAVLERYLAKAWPAGPTL